MKPTSIFRQILKILTAGVISIAILNIFCLFWGYDPQVKQIWSEDCPTGLSHRENQFFSRLYEGISFGFTDSSGYINKTAYEDNDIVLMGGSHIQALQVLDKENLTYLLDNEYFNSKAQKNVYNIAMAGWVFTDSAIYLDQVCRTLRPSQYLCVEVQNLQIDDTAIETALSTSPKSTNSYSKLKNLLMYVPFLRKLSGVITLNYIDNLYVDTSEHTYNTNLDKLLKKMVSVANKYNTKLCLFYHPSTAIDDDGNLVLSEDYAFLDKWKALAEQDNILFIDSTPYFKDIYEKEHILTYGFPNIGVGQGHLNKYGHMLVAQSIYDAIERYESERNQ